MKRHTVRSFAAVAMLLGVAIGLPVSPVTVAAGHHAQDRGTHLAQRVQVRGMPVLTSAPATNLKKYQGITLAAPPVGVSVISAAAAEHAALGREYGDEATVLEEVLAVEHNADTPSMDGCLCWVVSIMPADGNAYSSGEVMKVQYDLVFIDARTGVFAGEIQRGPVTQQQRGSPTP